jgi:DNA-binding PadR family transcriptional regulator
LHGTLAGVSTQKLTPVSYVVLGLIAMRGLSTSYDLKRACSHSIGYFWPFPHAQLYSEPKRLVGLGLLAVRSEDSGRRRQMYSITGDGMASLRKWLAEPTDEPLQVRDVAELKLFFGEFAEESDLRNLARQQIAQHRDRIAIYQAMQHRFGERRDIAGRMVPLRLGLAMEKAALNFWIELEKD